MSNIIPIDDLESGLTAVDQMAAAGQAASQAAAQYAFDDYLSRKSDNTLRNHLAALTLFVAYLKAGGVNGRTAQQLQTTPEPWRGVTWGLVEGFVKWLLGKGHSIASVNNRLSAIKAYTKLASKAGTIPSDEWRLIRIVSGYNQTEGKRVDSKRDTSRIGHKKSTHASITTDQAKKLMGQDLKTAQGRRDALLMCLLLDLGLRCGEVALLSVDEFDLAAETVTFYRPKVDKTQTHYLTPSTLKAAKAYLKHDAPDNGRLLLASVRGGQLVSRPMSPRAITKRAAVLGVAVGVVGLSAHACRHYWATDAARNGTNAFALRDAGGWSSLAMPGRYVEAAAVANEGVKLSTD